MIRLVLFHHPLCNSLGRLLIVTLLHSENEAVVVANVNAENVERWAVRFIG